MNVGRVPASRPLENWSLRDLRYSRGSGCCTWCRARRRRLHCHWCETGCQLWCHRCKQSRRWSKLKQSVRSWHNLNLRSSYQTQLRAKSNTITRNKCNAMWRVLTDLIRIYLIRYKCVQWLRWDHLLISIHVNPQNTKGRVSHVELGNCKQSYDPYWSGNEPFEEELMRSFHAASSKCKCTYV